MRTGGHAEEDDGTAARVGERLAPARPSALAPVTAVPIKSRRLIRGIGVKTLINSQSTAATIFFKHDLLNYKKLEEAAALHSSSWMPWWSHEQHGAIITVHPALAPYLFT